MGPPRLQQQRYQEQGTGWVDGNGTSYSNGPLLGAGGGGDEVLSEGQGRGGTGGWAEGWGRGGEGREGHY